MPVIKKAHISGEDFFDFNLKYLAFVGLWPDDDWPKIKKWLYTGYDISLHILSFIFLTTTGIGTYRLKDDTTAFMSNIDKTLVAYNCVFKSLIFEMKRKELKFLIAKIKASGDKISVERNQLMTNHVIFITIFATAVIGAFSFLSQLRGELVVDAWMPFNPYKNHFNLLLASQMLAASFVIPCPWRALALQGIIVSVLLYLCDQLKELQRRIRSLKYTPSGEADMRDELKRIIQKHVRLMGYSKSMNRVFKEFFLVQNTAVTVELCLNALMSTLVGLEEKKLLVSFLAFLCVTLLNEYIFCYLGNELIIQSESIALAAYESSWTSWPLDLQKNLLILIRVSQKPLNLSAGGMAFMSLQTYCQTLYNGYSIFAVLNDAID